MFVRPPLLNWKYFNDRQPSGIFFFFLEIIINNFKDMSIILIYKAIAYSYSFPFNNKLFNFFLSVIIQKNCLKNMKLLVLVLNKHNFSTRIRWLSFRFCGLKKIMLWFQYRLFSVCIQFWTRILFILYRSCNHGLEV